MATKKTDDEKAAKKKATEKKPQDKAALKAVAEALQKLEERKRFNKIEFFSPFPKQQEFFDQGAQFRQRLFSAGNQLGKTYAGAVEMVYHLTGDYPEDWIGKRYDRPIRAWAAGESALLVRGASQTLLCGTPGVPADLGSGFIPKSKIVGLPSQSRGVTDAIDTIHVKHKSGGVSALSFKSYEQGRAKFQAESVDVIWLDEECEMDIYTECVARTKNTRGIIFITFTPLQGRTELYKLFTDENKNERGFVNMTIYDRTDLTKEQIEEDIKQYPEHERDTRTKGIPSMGQGRIFMTTEEQIIEPAIQKIPLHWWKGWGVDFGTQHPFAAVLCCWDKESDIIHVTHAIRMKNALPIMHAAALKPIGINQPVFWPQDGTARKEFENQLMPLADIYKKHGLKMWPEHSTFPEGGYSTEIGVMEMNERFATGRLKFASHLSELREEYRMYHRKDGQIVKVGDDLLSAVRQFIMMKRNAKQGPIGGDKPNLKAEPPPEGSEFSWDWWR